MFDLFQWGACLLGMAGALTNSLGGRIGRATWPLWLVSNLLGLAVLVKLGAHGLVVQQIVYTVTTIMGGIRAFRPDVWTKLAGACEPSRTSETE